MKNALILFFLFLAGLSNASAQSLKNYRYDTDGLSKQFHRGRREALRAKLPEHGVAVFFSYPMRNYSNDTDYPYHPSPDFYYLTGFTECNAVLVVFKDQQGFKGLKSNEFLFVPEKNPSQEVWTGRMAGDAGAKELTGMDAVFNAAAFTESSFGWGSATEILYILPTGVVDTERNKNDLHDLVAAFDKKAGKKAKESNEDQLLKIMGELREIKTPEELVLLRKAIEMSCEGHNEMMRTLTPGMAEYNAQAVGEYVFRRNGAEYMGYPSICGGAENACILHYNSNRRPLVDGDIQLNDMGAEYHGYTADVTRTIPVSGKFTEEQKAIYNLVLEAQTKGIEVAKVGADFNDTFRVSAQVIGNGLVKLGIIANPNDYGKYFMHGTSHYLGLDVHDAGTYGPLKANSVITVEPGIYIAEGSPCDPKWWNIGVRIEDDILITENGPVNLSASSPRTVEDIEKMMAEEPAFIKK